MKVKMTKTNVDGYSIDPSTAFVINTNDAEFSAHKAERERRKRTKMFEDRLEAIERTQRELQKQLSEILEKIS